MDPLPMTWRYLGGCPFGALAKKLSLVVTQEQNDLNPALQWHLHNAALVQRVLLGGWTGEPNWLIADTMHCSNWLIILGKNGHEFSNTSCNLFHRISRDRWNRMLGAPVMVKHQLWWNQPPLSLVISWGQQLLLDHPERLVPSFKQCSI